MPFDYEEYAEKCSTMNAAQLQLEWENYTRQLAGGATSTTCSVLFSPVTGGVSLVGLGISAPRVHNARKKRDIVEKCLLAQGLTHTTRKRDVALPAAISGTLGGLTLGLAGPGADLLGGVAAEKGAEYLVSHAVLEGAGAVFEHEHTNHEKDKAFEKRGKTPVPGQLVAETTVSGGQSVYFQHQAFQAQFQPAQAQAQAQVQVQQEHYEAVSIPPSYHTSPQLPLYQPPQLHGQQNAQQILEQAPQPHTQYAFPVPEKVLHVVGNPLAGQPFGLEARAYSAQNATTWSPAEILPQSTQPTYFGEKNNTLIGPPLQPVMGLQQWGGVPPILKTDAEPESPPSLISAPPPWTCDYNKWEPSKEDTRSEQDTKFMAEIGSLLEPQSLSTSSPAQSKYEANAPKPVRADQEVSVPFLEVRPPLPPRTPVSGEQPAYALPNTQRQQQQQVVGQDSTLAAMSGLSLNSPPSQSPAMQYQQHQYQFPPPPPQQQNYQSSPHPPQQQQYQFQYQPAAYAPSPSPGPQQQLFFAPPPTSLHPGSIPRPTSSNARLTRPTSMLSLSSLGSTLATSLAKATSRPSSPSPSHQNLLQNNNYPQSPASWTGPPSAMSPPPGYASGAPTPGLRIGGDRQYAYVSPPPAYVSPAHSGNGNGLMLQGKDYFSQGQQQQQQVPVVGHVQYFSNGAPPSGQWGQ